MGCALCLLFWLALPVAVAGLIWYYLNSWRFTKGKVPEEFYKDSYYGKGKLEQDDTSIRSFEFPQISDEDIGDLKNRLSRTRFNPPLEDVKDFDYGFNIDYLKTVVDYWINQYDWRKQEARIKSFDHYVTQIEGIQVHFVHIKPKTGKCKTPLLMSAGWPSSFYEYIKVLEIIREDNDKGQCMEVIIPSIPGYGFSERPHKKGFNSVACARIFAKLMQRLGHERYYVHGSDWGAMIGMIITAMYPERVMGYHTTTFFTSYDLRFVLRTLLCKLFPSYMLDNPERDLKLLFPISKTIFYILRESGYMHIQATRPDTVAAGLNDSPAGLAAYILEKYSVWTKEDFRFKPTGELTRKYSLDDLLTMVSLYWFTQTINTSQRFYKENFSCAPVNHQLQVPSGVTMVGNGMLDAPTSFSRSALNNLVYESHLDDGGHFLALEDPTTFWKEVKMFICACERRTASR